jgi:hypothetical protein
VKKIVIVSENNNKNGRCFCWERLGRPPSVEKRKIDALHLSIRIEIGNLFANGRNSLPGKSLK